MLLSPTFVLLVLAAAQLTVCAPMNSAVESAEVVIKSDGGIVGKEEVTSSVAAVPPPVPDSTGTRRCGCACSHAKPKPQESGTKIEENAVKSSSTQDAIPTGTVTEKQGDFLYL